MNISILFFYLSCLLAFVSGHMVNYSVILYAQDVLQSDFLSGLGFGLCFGPAIILGWYAGVLCDRLAPGRLIILSQLIFIGAGGVLLIASTLAVVPEEKAASLIFAAFLAGCGWSFIAPARFAALAQIVPQNRLHGATIVLNLMTMLGFGVAPIVISVLLGKFGWSGVFISIMLSFSVATVLMIWTPTQPTIKEKKHVLAEIRQGLHVVLSKPLLLQLLLTSVLVYSLMGPMQVLLPRLASEQLMLVSVDRGLYLAVLALALLIGGILCMAMRRRLHDGRTILVGILIAGLLIIALSQISIPWLSVLILLATGVFGGIVVSLIVAGLQNEADADTRGRIMSMYTISSQVIPAASGFIAGAFSEYIGVVAALLVCGGALAAAALLGLVKLSAVRSYIRV